MKKARKVRSIGLSNFESARLEEVLEPRLDRNERFYKTAQLSLEEQEGIMCGWRASDRDT